MITRPIGTLPLVVGMLLLAVGFLARSFALDADPANHYIPGDIGYHVDEGYKTLAPRNLVRFGTTTAHPEDGYGDGWMTASPVTQWPYIYAFRWAGTTELTPARVVSLGYFLLVALALGYFVWVRWGGWFVPLAIGLFVSDITLFHFSRSALFEMAIIGFMYLGLFLAFAERLRSGRVLSIAIVILVGAIASYYIKLSSAVYLLPAIGGMLGSALVTSRRSSLIFTTAAVLSVLFLYSTSRAWLSRLELGQLSTWTVLQNDMHLLAPTTTILGYLGTILILRVKGLSETLKDGYHVALISIFVLTPLVLSLFAYDPLRYYVPAVPAGLLLAIEAIGVFRKRTDSPGGQGDWKSWLAMLLLCIPLATVIQNSFIEYVLPWLPFLQGENPGVSEPVQKVLLPIAVGGLICGMFVLHKHLSVTVSAAVLATAALHLIVCTAWQYRHLSAPTYDAQRIGNLLATIVKEGELVGGDWAPMLTTGTEVRAIYMDRHYNNAATIHTVKPRYFVDAGRPDDEHNMSGMLARKDITVTEISSLGSFHGHELVLYELHFGGSG